MGHSADKNIANSLSKGEKLWKQWAALAPMGPNRPFDYWETFGSSEPLGELGMRHKLSEP
jgi:hypothetical protein